MAVVLIVSFLKIYHFMRVILRRTYEINKTTKLFSKVSKTSGDLLLKIIEMTIISPVEGENSQKVIRHHVLEV